MNVTALRYSAPALTGHSAGRINQFIHRLQRCGAIPSNGAGRPAAEIDPGHVAAFLVAMAIEGDPETAVSTLPDWLSMQSQDGAVPFGEELRRVILTHPNDVREVRICRAWPRATIIRDTGAVAEFGYRDMRSAQSAGYATAPVRDETVIPGSVLDTLAGECRETQGGWGRP